MQSTYFLAAIFLRFLNQCLGGRPMRVLAELTNYTTYPRLNSFDKLRV